VLHSPSWHQQEARPKRDARPIAFIDCLAMTSADSVRTRAQPAPFLRPKPESTLPTCAGSRMVGSAPRSTRTRSSRWHSARTSRRGSIRTRDRRFATGTRHESWKHSWHSPTRVGTGIRTLESDTHLGGGSTWPCTQAASASWWRLRSNPTSPGFSSCFDGSRPRSRHCRPGGLGPDQVDVRAIATLDRQVDADDPGDRA